MSASVGVIPPPPPTSSIHRAVRTSGGSGGTRTSTSSVGSTFSLEVTIPEDGREKERRTSTSSSTTTSRMKRPSGRSSLGSSTGGGGARDSSGSSLLEPPTSFHRPALSKRSSGDEVNTPTSTASTLSIPMPVTPQDYDALLSSVTTLKGSVFGGSGKFDKEKSLLPLPTGGLRRSGSSTNLKATVTSATTNAKSTPTLKLTSHWKKNNTLGWCKLHFSACADVFFHVFCLCLVSEVGRWWRRCGSRRSAHASVAAAAATTSVLAG